MLEQLNANQEAQNLNKNKIFHRRTNHFIQAEKIVM